MHRTCCPLHGWPSPLFQLVYVDDLEWPVQGSLALDDLLLLLIFVYVAVGVPFAWHKFRAAWNMVGRAFTYVSRKDPWDFHSNGRDGSATG